MSEKMYEKEILDLLKQVVQNQARQSAVARPLEVRLKEVLSTVTVTDSALVDIQTALDDINTTLTNIGTAQATASKQSAIISTMVGLMSELQKANLHGGNPSFSCSWSGGYLVGMYKTISAVTYSITQTWSGGMLVSRTAWT